ncbi:hypothetical protein IEE91_01285 [Kocuria sp. cx-455]|uniref:hypothetical protein n=1 Tax=Kocuria sp. cx-455 TaxID=2771377 RepID=UPI0016893720|nr:hypothetical protein [Kocuria sp. cx-455]MBD2763844.1 hypothetical protein [Kocuria sp. cx-455]
MNLLTWKRVATATATSGLLLALTGCSSSADSAEGPITFEAPSEIPQQDSESQAPVGTGQTASTGTCLDVVEVYTGLVVLPMTTDQSTDATAEPGQDSSVVAEATASLESHRNRLPEPVLPAFDDAVRLLSNAGETLQPQEAAQIQRALQPVQDWISTQCSAALPEK